MTYPRNIATSREQAQAETQADLASRVLALERQQANQIQRGYDEKLEEIIQSGAGGLGESHDMGGPSVTVHVEEGQIVMVGWKAEIKPGLAQAAFVSLHEPTDFAVGFLWEPEHITLGYRQDSNSYKAGSTNALTMFPLDWNEQFTYASWAPVPMMTAFPASPGERTYSLRYGRDGNNNDAFFRKRRLWVVVI